MKAHSPPPGAATPPVEIATAGAQKLRHTETATPCSVLVLTVHTVEKMPSLQRPFVVQRIDDAGLDHRLAPSRERPIVRRHRHRGELLKHQHDLGRELEPDRHVPMPFVRWAFGAQPIGDLGVEKAGNQPQKGMSQREIAAGVEARFARPPGVPLLSRRVRIMGSRNERGRLAREHPFAGRPELLPQAQARIVEAVIGVRRGLADRIMFERRLAKSGERVGEAVLNIGLRVEAALVGRGIAAPGRPESSPAVKGFDELAGSLRHGPGAAKRGRRRAGDKRERGCGSPPTVRAGAGQDHAPQRELRSPART